MQKAISQSLVICFKLAINVLIKYSTWTFVYLDVYIATHLYKTLLWNRIFQNGVFEDGLDWC